VRVTAAIPILGTVLLITSMLFLLWSVVERNARVDAATAEVIAAQDTAKAVTETAVALTAQATYKAQTAEAFYATQTSQAIHATQTASAVNEIEAAQATHVAQTATADAPKYCVLVDRGNSGNTLIRSVDDRDKVIGSVEPGTLLPVYRNVGNDYIIRFTEDGIYEEGLILDAPGVSSTDKKDCSPPQLIQS